MTLLAPLHQDETSSRVERAVEVWRVARHQAARRECVPVQKQAL